MWIADDVRVGAVGAHAVGDAGVVSEDAVQDAKGSAGIKRGDAGVLPVGKKNLGNAFQVAGRNVVNPADIEDVALVEIGTAIVAVEVVRVDEVDVLPVGSVVKGVRVGVSDADDERRDGATDRNLQSVVIGIRAVFFSGDIAVPDEVGADEVGIDVAAGHVEIILHKDRQGAYVLSIGDTVDAVAGAQRNARRIGILGGGGGHQLVQIALVGQVGAFAANVGDGTDDVLGEFVLDADIPLLHVGPDGVVGNGSDRQGKGEGAAGSSQAGVTGRLAAAGTGDVRLVGSEDQGSATFQALGVGFAAVSVIEKDPVAAANGRLAIAFGIKGEAHSRSGVNPVVVQTSPRNARAAALNDAVEKILIVGRIGVGKRDIGDWIEQRSGVGIE